MTGWFDHELAGCAPEPLAAYLKALGVMRVLGSQTDPGARGVWRGDTFVLTTRLDRSALLEFFTWEYRPTPMVSPWNSGSGFYPHDNTTGIDAIAASTAPRFAAYREAIAIGRELTRGLAEAPRDEAKIDLVRACRARMRGPAAEWMDTALVRTPNGELRYPALLGTGGNDGRLDFSNNQMQCLSELLSTTADEPRGDAEELLEAALFGEPVAGLYPRKAIGQFWPGAVGGPNSTSLGRGPSLVNPWEFVLMLEGALLLYVSEARRMDAATMPQASAPFAVRSQAVDYASASPADESARGEQWMPLWSEPVTLAELRMLFADAWLVAGMRRARGALDAARTVARLGTPRAVRAFVRVGFLERNGQAHLAVPLGRWRVAAQPHVHLLDELERWIDVHRQRCASPHAPAALGEHVRAIERAMVVLCREGDQPARWGELLCALGRFEDRMVARPRSVPEVRIAAVPTLSPEWVIAADDGSAEFRLAAALASQYSRDLRSVRRHCVPRSPRRTARYGGRFHITRRGTYGGRDLIWTGLDPIADLCALAWRRLLRSRTGNLGGFELRGRLAARPGDIHAFLSGALDDARLAALARGLMAVRWRERTARDLPLRGATLPDRAPWPVYAPFRLLYLPAPRTGGDPVEARPGAVDPAPLRLLISGRLVEAVRLALRRLGLPGLRAPHIADALAGAPMDAPRLARRLAASLCFPIRTDGERSDIARLRRALLHEGS